MGSLPLYFPSSLSWRKVSLSHSFLTVYSATIGCLRAYSLLLPHCSKEPLSETASPRPLRRGLTMGAFSSLFRHNSRLHKYKTRNNTCIHKYIHSLQNSSIREVHVGRLSPVTQPPNTRLYVWHMSESLWLGLIFVKGMISQILKKVIH